MTRHLLAIVPAILLASACGGGTASNASPERPTPPTGSNSLTGVVYYDQNGNGGLDADESVRLPGVRVAVGSQIGTAGANGQFTVTGLPDGPQALSVQTDSLPPYFQPVAVPPPALPMAAGVVIPVPVSLPIAGNRPNTYLAFGDSITEGTGSLRRQGWATPLQERLRAHWGEAEVIADGVRASRSVDGIERLPASLAESRPAFLLILYGTNDWNRCQSLAPSSCFTVTALRDMIRAARASGTQPVVGTLIPANPADVDRMPVERNRWIQSENDLIRAMVQQEGAVLAETWAAFGSDPALWPPLFFDHLHPVDAGYARISDAFFQALTRSRGSR